MLFRSESLEDLAPVDAGGNFAAVAGFENVADSSEDTQLPLRAMFLTEGKINADSVVAHFNELPGIEDGVVLGNASAVVSSAPGFSEQASTLHRSLSELISAAGVEESERFTIRTDSAMVSFFSGEGFAIGIKHDPQGFRPGVSERLQFVAQHLGTLVN